MKFMRKMRTGVNRTTVRRTRKRKFWTWSSHFAEILFYKEESKESEKPKKLSKRHGDKHVWLHCIYCIWITSDSVHSTKTDESDTDTRTDKSDKGNSFSERYEFHNRKCKKIIKTPETRKE